MIYANSFPKSGTGLLRQVLKPFGPDNQHFGMYDRVTGQPCKHQAVVNTLKKLNRLDGFVTTHLHWHPDFEEEIFPDHKMIILIRDPREVVVSHVKYVRAMPDHNLHKLYMSYEEKTCYWITMRGLPDSPAAFPDLAARFLPYLGWCRGRGDHNVLTLSYAELKAYPSQTCRKIASHIYPVPPPDVEDFNVLVGRMLAGIDPEKSNTYRPGDHKRWQDEMPEEAQEYFNEHFRWLLNLMNGMMYV